MHIQSDPESLPLPMKNCSWDWCCECSDLAGPASICLAMSLPFPVSQAGVSRRWEWLVTRSVSPPRPNSRATASARAILDSAGWMKISSGFDLDLGRVSWFWERSGWRSGPRVLHRVTLRSPFGWRFSRSLPRYWRRFWQPLKFDEKLGRGKCDDL